MAIYLTIRQIEITPTEAVYEFTTSEGRQVGRFTIYLDTGSVRLDQPLPGENGEAHFARASYKIHKQWENGELPKETCWAS